VFPDDALENGLAAERAAASAHRPAGEVGEKPFARLGADDFPVSGFLQRPVLVMPRGDHGWLRIQLIRPEDRAAAGGGDAVVPAGAPLGEHEVIPAVLFVEV